MNLENRFFCIIEKEKIIFDICWSVVLNLHFRAFFKFKHNGLKYNILFLYLVLFLLFIE